MFLLLGGGGMGFFSWVHLRILPEASHSLWDRFLIMGVMWIIWGWSFRKAVKAKQIHRITNYVLYAFTFYSTYIAYITGWPYTYSLSSLIVVSTIFLHFNDRSQIVFYSWFSAIVLAIFMFIHPWNNAFWGVFLYNLYAVNIFINYWVGSRRIQSIQEMAQQKHTIRSQQSTLSSLIESSSDLIWSVNRSGQLTTFNQAFSKVFAQKYGVQVWAMMNLNVQFQQLNMESPWSTAFSSAFKGQQLSLEDHIEVGGETHWYNFTFNPIFQGENIIGTSVFGQNITAYKKAEADLRASEERFSAAVQGSKDGIWDWDLKRQVYYFSHQCKEILGYRPDELPSDILKWMSMIHREDQARVQKEIEKHIKEKTPFLRGEFRMRHKDGHFIWILARGKAIYDEKGHAIRLAGSNTDITDLKNTREILSGVLNSSHSGIMAIRAVRNHEKKIVDFTSTLLNVRGADLSKKSTEEILDQSLKQVFPEVEENGIFELFAQAVEEGKAFEHELFRTEPSGQGVWFHITGSKLADGLTITFTDITSRKENEQRARLLSHVASETDNAVVIADQHGIVEWVNEGFTNMSGYALASSVGKHFADILHGPESVIIPEEDLLPTLKQGKALIFENRYYDINGAPYWVSVNLNALMSKEGDLEKTILVATNITAQKQIQEDLERAKQAAEDAAMAKAEFLATMSHEIRTPMNAVIGMTGLLLETPLSEEQKEYVETVRISGDNLLTVINDILDFSKIDSGKLELEAQPFSMESTIEDVLDLLSTKAEEKGLELLYDTAPGTPDFIVSDPTRLNQILVNLTGNALKFTDEGEILIHVREVNRGPESSLLEFEVRDTGIGIPPEKMDRLFRSFSQVDASTTRKYGGTGLGLAICKKLVGLMGGRIWIESEVGKGSSFFFTIQAGRASVPVQAIPSATALQGKRTLLIDDNETNLTILQRQCEGWGMQCLAVSSPAQALEIWEAKPAFDLVITDMQMPDMNGYELAKALIEKGCQVPLVLLTSMGENALEEEKAMFAARLTKPVRRALLRKHLQNILGHSQQQKTQPIPAEEPAIVLPQNLNILLVEDNVINQKVALRILSKLNLKADVAGNGLEALKALELKSYDLIFMDMQMPEMDGLEATRCIRDLGEKLDQPLIIAMTANAMKGDKERCLEAGMDDYISKPVKIKHIQDAVFRWFVQDKSSVPS